MKWLKRGLLGLFLLVVGLAIAGLAYQEIATALDRRAFPPPGQLADIGGRNLHYRCAGEGSPTVILEAGLGGISSDWIWVQEGVAAVTRVCSYDRAGSGWSDRGPSRRDGDAIVADLHALLRAAAIPGPYVLVGHSFGGLYVRTYGLAYPQEVAGMVLVESTHPEQWVRRPEGQEQHDSIARLYGIARLAARLGILRLADFLPRDPALPEREAAAREAMGETSASIDTAADEFNSQDGMRAPLAAPGGPGQLPLAVVTAGERPGETPESVASWGALQDDLATLSSNSSHDVVEDATHMSIVTDHEHSAAVVAAILRIVQALREAPVRLPQ